MQRINDTRELDIFTIDHAIHEPQMINTLTSEFDRVIELRQADTGERETRIQGLSDVLDTWRTFGKELWGRRWYQPTISALATNHGG